VGSPVSNLEALSAEEHSWVELANMDSQGKEILSSAQIPALHAAVMAACANSQGYIPDPRSCGFNPASIQCPAGVTSDSCLTPAQVGAATRIYRGPTDPQGKPLYPGGEPYGSELAWIGTFIEPASDTAWPDDTIDGGSPGRWSPTKPSPRSCRASRDRLAVHRRLRPEAAGAHAAVRRDRPGPVRIGTYSTRLMWCTDNGMDVSCKISSRDPSS
jgi:hypothetical protein